MPLKICESSHCSVGGVSQIQRKELISGSVVRLVEVRLSLMVVGNDDTLHWGPAWVGRGASFTCSADTKLYHVQLVKEGYSLPDGIHYLLDFKLRFLHPPPTNQNDLDPKMEAARRESLLVEQASTETSAETRKSDEPELESTKALTQRGSCFTHIEQAPCSSRKM